LYSLKQIGVIHTTFKTKEATPIQGAFNPDAEGTVEVFPEYADGLKDIETFSHIWLFYLFDRAGDLPLVLPVFLDDEPHGVFATRHPSRPNGIGMTAVRLIRISGRVLDVSGIDVLDGTPLIDIKPYVSRFDSIDDASDGWLEGKGERKKPPGRE